MKGATLVLVRHAHTWSNGGHARPRMSGWTDCALSANGHRQVRRLSARLSAEKPFAAIYSSPLRRALQTAIPLAAAGRVALEICPELREIGCGNVDGALVEQVAEDYPDLWLANLRQEDDHFRWPGGESYAELRERALSAIREIGRRHPGERVALVTHAGVISQLVGFLRGTRPARWGEHRAENTSLTELVFDAGALSLASFDDHRHLTDEVRWAEGPDRSRYSAPERVGSA